MAETVPPGLTGAVDAKWDTPSESAPLARTRGPVNQRAGAAGQRIHGGSICKYLPRYRVRRRPQSRIHVIDSFNQRGSARHAERARQYVDSPRRLANG